MNPMKLGEPQVDDKHSIFATLYFQRMLQNELIDLHILKIHNCNPCNFDPQSFITLYRKNSSFTKKELFSCFNFLCFLLLINLRSYFTVSVLSTGAQ